MPLSNDNVVLRGMSLKNTEWILGCVVYTGHQTKIQMNSSKGKYKMSKMMQYTNLFIVLILILQVLLSSIAGTLGTVWTEMNIENSYLMFDKVNAKGETMSEKDPYYVWMKLTGSWVLITTNFVPISLLVTLEMVKFFQGIFMQMDVVMYDEDQQYPMRAQSTNINEEVGQIEYIFSDKTGTLTCNIMEFKKFSTASAGSSPTSYEVFDRKPSQVEAEPADNELLKQESLLRYRTRGELLNTLKSYGTPDENGVREFMLHLATCHTVVIDKNTGGLNSASPDELALVEGAKDYGYEFIGKDKEGCILVTTPDKKTMRYKLLNVCEFNSTRKRMSVIVRDMQTNEIVVLSKGADSIMEKLLIKNDREHDKRLSITKSYLDAYASEGLRTLLLTKRTIQENEYNAWLEEYNRASNSMHMREEKIDAVNAKIEVEMSLIGASAIEDRLQDEVSETIIALKDTGIKVWVLTGDKVETAVNIGYSAGLLNNEMSQFYVDSVTIGGISHQMADIVE